MDHKLPTHPLQDVDVKRGRDAIKNDPLLASHRPWVKAIEQWIDASHRAK